MLKTCEMCSSDFLTEADPYVVVPGSNGAKFYCSCMIVKCTEDNKIKELEAKNKIMAEALEFYADSRNWKVCTGESWLSTLKKEDCSMLNCGGGRARLALRINRGEL